MTRRLACSCCVGVDSICVIVLWIYTYKVDEYQLTDFIIKSKGLQFITSGLISGALAFFKMYKCSIQEEGSPLACEHKAPGMLPTFPFEFSLLLVRTDSPAPIPHSDSPL